MRVWRFIISAEEKAIRCYRLSVWLFSKPGRVGRGLGRLVMGYATSRTACHISPLAKIGPGFRLYHATGVVIGQGVTIGRNVSVYQNVTIGERHGGTSGMPVIEDDVIIFAGAVIAGPVTIGRNAVIGANAVVFKDVPANAVAVGVPARIIRQNGTP